MLKVSNFHLFLLIFKLLLIILCHIEHFNSYLPVVLKIQKGLVIFYDTVFCFNQTLPLLIFFKCLVVKLFSGVLIISYSLMRKFKIFIYTFNFMGKIYPILVLFSIFSLKCMVKNDFKNVFGNTCC